jgi:hypothetical protein
MGRNHARCGTRSYLGKDYEEMKLLVDSCCHNKQQQQNLFHSIGTLVLLYVL